MLVANIKKRKATKTSEKTWIRFYCIQIRLKYQDVGLNKLNLCIILVAYTFLYDSNYCSSTQLSY